ncbi:helix-turn-helix domain-containing protein [Parerythrobacter aurantius]|uniref:AraC family transcriptional regulator n=1 Tax=Parerythrobacter aurantius TaxID=3127706 RepID=UPI00324A7D90
MSETAALDLQFFPAPAELADCISTIYRLDVDLAAGEMLSDELLPEWGNLRFVSHSQEREGHLGACRLGEGGFYASGPSDRRTPVELGKTRLWGVGLLPLGWASLVRAPAGELANQVFDGARHPAFAQFASIAKELDRSAIDDATEYECLCKGLLQHARPPRDEQRIRDVQQVMSDPYLVQIPDFATRAGISVRTLERICLRYFGFSPNVVLRRQRLVRSLASFMSEETARWSDAIDRHYHDQSHFVREFHHFMGMSPTDYASRPHPIVGSFIQNRQRVWGRPALAGDDVPASLA